VGIFQDANLVKAKVIVVGFVLVVIAAAVTSVPGVVAQDRTHISQPAISQPAISQSAISQSAISQPAISQSAISQSAISQSAISQSAISQSVEVSAVSKSGMNRPSSAQPDSDAMIGVSVRVIRAEDRRAAANQSLDSPNNGKGIDQKFEQSIDPGLADIRMQLSKLQYVRFALVTIQQRQVGLMKRESLSLPDGHSLTLRPMYLENNRVGMWIRWADASGDPVIDTRMHFSCGQTLVAGTDIGMSALGADPANRSALILAINAKPLEK